VFNVKTPPVFGRPEKKLPDCKSTDDRRGPGARQQVHQRREQVRLDREIPIRRLHPIAFCAAPDLFRKSPLRIVIAHVLDD